MTNKSKKKNVSKTPVQVKIIERTPKTPKTKKHGPVTVQRSVAESLGDAASGLVRGGVGALSKWLGFGAYTINHNTVIGAGGTIPSMHSTNDSVIVRHREFMGNIQSTTGFASVSIPMNPGLQSSFPWLSKTAQNYQEYKILGMVVEYLPLISEVASNELSLGVVVLAAQYRSDLPNYPSVAMAMESEFAVSTKPNASACLAIECDPALSPYKAWYIRTNPRMLGNADVKTFDFVDVNVLTEGFQTAGQIAGQLWVSYEIELMHPTAYLDPPVTQFYFHAFNNAGITNSNPLGTAGTVSISSYVNPTGENTYGMSFNQMFTQDGATITNPDPGRIAVSLPRGALGTFQVTIVNTGNAGTNQIAGSAFAINNGTIFQNYPSSNAVVAPTTLSTTTVHTMFQAWFVINNTQASAGQCTIYCMDSTTVVGGGNLSVDVYIAQICSIA
jgi:hypothetical protein